MSLLRNVLRGQAGIRSFKADAATINSIPAKEFGPLVEKAVQAEYGDPGLIPSRVKEFTDDAVKRLKLSHATVNTILRVIGGISESFVSEASTSKFEEELVSYGIEKEHAALLASSLQPYRDQIQADSKQGIRERFGPVLSFLAWRVDTPVSGTEPFFKEPVAQVVIRLEDEFDSENLKIELEISDLDYLIGELTNVRSAMTQALSRISPNSRSPS